MCRVCLFVFVSEVKLLCLLETGNILFFNTSRIGRGQAGGGDSKRFHIQLQDAEGPLIAKWNASKLLTRTALRVKLSYLILSSPHSISKKLSVSH